MLATISFSFQGQGQGHRSRSDKWLIYLPKAIKVEQIYNVPNSHNFTEWRRRLSELNGTMRTWRRGRRAGGVPHKSSEVIHFERWYHIHHSFQLTVRSRSVSHGPLFSLHRETIRTMLHSSINALCSLLRFRGVAMTASGKIKSKIRDCYISRVLVYVLHVEYLKSKPMNLYSVLL